MNLGVEGASFRELVPLYVGADTIIIGGVVVKNSFGDVWDLDEQGVEGRKEYLEEVVEVKKEIIKVYTRGRLERLLGEERSRGGLDYIKLKKEGVMKIHTEHED